MVMKNLAKYAIGVLALAGAAALTTAPADARVFVGFGAGPGYYGPGPYDGQGPYYGQGPYGPGANCDPYYPEYDPYYCGGYSGYDYGPYGGGPNVAFGFGGGYGHYWGHGGRGGHGGWGRGHHH
jgi:hypothetical protein